jgi:hemoglobin
MTRLNGDLVRHATVSGSEVTQPMSARDSRSEIHALVVRFYREIVFDELLGPVVGEVAEVDWSIHIPKLIDFWCRVLLGQPGYEGYILHAHQEVHAIEAFQLELFDRWYLLFTETVDDGWEGPIAEAAKAHAARMAGVLARRLLGVDWNPPKQRVVASVCHRTRVESRLRQ